MKTENPLITEARAKITWGDSPLEVRAFLTSSGVPGEEADRQLAQLLAERNNDIRKAALRNIIIGCALLIPGGFGVWVILSPSRGHYIGTSGAKGIGVALGLGGWGLWKLTNGLISLARPDTEHGAVSDVSG